MKKYELIPNDGRKSFYGKAVENLLKEFCLKNGGLKNEVL